MNKSTFKKSTFSKGGANQPLRKVEPNSNS